VSAYCGALPLLPGKTEEARRLARELSGARADEWAASCERLGVSCGEWFFQQSPEIDLLIVWFEAADPAAVFVGLAASDEPFDVWFRQAAAEVTGLTLGELGARPLPQKVLDYSV
jgi:hypothetical protein